MSCVHLDAASVVVVILLQSVLHPIVSSYDSPEKYVLYVEYVLALTAARLARLPSMLTGTLGMLL